jgi:hypothetical protein
MYPSLASLLILACNIMYASLASLLISTQELLYAVTDKSSVEYLLQVAWHNDTQQIPSHSSSLPVELGFLHGTPSTKTLP